MRKDLGMIRKVTKKLYIDTNIIVYAIENSRNLYGKDISRPSVRLFFEALSCKYELIISSWTLQELNYLRKLENVGTFIGMLKKKIIKIEHTEEDISRAKKENPEHFQDELHGMLALKSGADYIVTRDIKGFLHFRDRICIVKPEELI